MEGYPFETFRKDFQDLLETRVFSIDREPEEVVLHVRFANLFKDEEAFRLLYDYYRTRDAGLRVTGYFDNSIPEIEALVAKFEKQASPHSDKFFKMVGDKLGREINIGPVLKEYGDHFQFPVEKQFLKEFVDALKPKTVRGGWLTERLRSELYEHIDRFAEQGVYEKRAAELASPDYRTEADYYQQQAQFYVEYLLQDKRWGRIATLSELMGRSLALQEKKQDNSNALFFADSFMDYKEKIGGLVDEIIWDLPESVHYVVQPSFFAVLSNPRNKTGNQRFLMGEEKQIACAEALTSLVTELACAAAREKGDDLSAGRR